AAQQEMVITGKMHGYMRMYWGKKILEWSPTPQEAFQRCLYLNNKYELDGRDPNGYTGVAWCFGKHDRAWKERPIFGKVRYMNDHGLKRKYDMEKYVQIVRQLKEKT
ncbi:MAG: deoxyribodipyrimidine photolyase, partial [Calditrichaeota bacterium]